MHGTSYIHMLEERLRIKVAEMKGSRERTLETEKTITQLNGISQVKANLITGNLLVLFDAQLTNRYHIIGALKDLGYLNEKYLPHQQSSSRWLEAIVGPIAQTMIERAIFALI